MESSHDPHPERSGVGRRDPPRSVAVARGPHPALLDALRPCRKEVGRASGATSARRESTPRRWLTGGILYLGRLSGLNFAGTQPRRSNLDRRHREHLFDLGPTERRPITGRALVVLSGCPECGGELTTLTTWQPALFIACDYGAAKASTVKRCPECHWWLATGHASVNPRVFA